MTEWYESTTLYKPSTSQQEAKMCFIDCESIISVRSNNKCFFRVFVPESAIAQPNKGVVGGESVYTRNLCVMTSYIFKFSKKFKKQRVSPTLSLKCIWNVGLKDLLSEWQDTVTTEVWSDWMDQCLLSSLLVPFVTGHWISMDLFHTCTKPGQIASKAYEDLR